jgi:A/G-specific adenine glycosylase
MSGFFHAVVAWQRQQGRHCLPWQGTTDPYRVWLSEIMLQQTQVATVLAYYARFLSRFPDVQSLAAADTAEVLALWGGLGYYSRARHLHRCARVVVSRWNGRFPSTAANLETLPGIGPSTAAAIAAFCFGEPVSIMDGNVQRVLTRWLAFDKDLAQATHARALWQCAQGLVPPTAAHEDMMAYTQGLMDLGATVCRRSKPECPVCPVAQTCQALAQGQAVRFPVKTRKLKRRTESWWLQVWRRTDGAYWLQPRQSTGIWAGLHAFPVVMSAEEAEARPPHADDGADAVWHEPLRHSLTHRELVLHPVEWTVGRLPIAAAGCWVSRQSDLTMGLPTPIRQWLEARLPD